MIGSRWMQRIAPWKWMPLIVFLTLQVRLTDVVHIAGTYLIIPVGAHLARRYGRAGFMVLALSALPLVGEVSFGSVSTTQAPGVYLAALLISWFLQKHSPAHIKIPQLRLSPWVLICLFVLTLHIGLGSYDILWFENVHWMADGVTLFYLLIFVLGLSRAPMQPVLIALTLAVFLGVMLEYASLPLDAAQWLQASQAELPWFGLMDLRSFHASYRFDSSAELLTAFGFLRFGRFLSDQHCRGDALSLPSPMHRIVLISAVLFLALGGEINDYLLPRDNPALRLFGSFYATLLAGMLAGFYFRFAGILLMLFMVTGFWWIDAVLRADLNIIRPFFYFNIDDLLYAYGFGLLGIGMRDVLARTSSRLWRREWFLYLGLYLVVLFSVIPLEGAYDLFIILMAFFAGIALTLGAKRIRERLAKTEIALTGGWLSLVCLIMMGYLVYHFSKESWQDVQTTLQQVADMVGQLVSAKKAMDEEDLMLVGFLAGAILTGFWLLTSTLAGLLKSINQLTADLRVVLQRLRSKVPMILKFKRRKDGPSPNGSVKFPLYLSNVLTWTNRAMLAAFISLFILLTTYNAWVDYQNDRARKARYRNTSASPSEEMLQQRKEREKARADVAARLTLAAQGVLKDYPNVNVDSNDYQITITSGWHTTPAESKIRRRVYIAIRPVAKFNDMNPEKSLGQSITVTLYRQDRGRFNLWVEHSPSRNREDKRALENELEEAIVTAAIEESQRFPQNSRYPL